MKKAFPVHSIWEAHSAEGGKAGHATDLPLFACGVAVMSANQAVGALVPPKNDDNAVTFIWW